MAVQEFIEERTEARPDRRSTERQRQYWERPRQHSTKENGDGTAKGLGWFSIGLGLTELVAPGLVATIAGTRNRSGLIRFYGLREIACGLGILTQPRNAGWLWARVCGDAVDLATLGAAMASRHSDTGRNVFAIASVAGVTVADLISASKLSAQSQARTSRVSARIVLNRPPEEVYSFWRDFQNLPRFMQDLESVRVIDNTRSHWTARVPDGPALEWDAEVTTDQPNRLISWRSLPDSSIETSGTVRFQPAPGNRGTLLAVEMRFNLAAGRTGLTLPKLFGAIPERMIHENLRRLKQVLEAGEIATTAGQPFGPRTPIGRMAESLENAISGR